MKTSKYDVNLTLTTYARDNNSHHTPNLNWARILINNPNNLIRISYIFTVLTKLHNIKYKYVVKVLHNIRGVINFYHEKGNTFFQDSIFN